MSIPDFKPWWEKPNDYLSFEERDQFLVGAQAYRPDKQQQLMFGLLSAGYIRKAGDVPKSYTGKKPQ